MDNEMVVIRNPNKKVYTAFKQLAAKEELSMGKAITEAMLDYIKKKAGMRQKIDIGNLQKMEGFVKTGRKVRWSEQVDDILYG